LDFEGDTFAGFERSDCENLIKNCMSAVTIAKLNTENATPFQEDSSEDH